METIDFEYFKNKKADKFYLSKQIDHKDVAFDGDGDFTTTTRPIRILSKVIDGKETHTFIKKGSAISLRISGGERQEIQARFYEDSRNVTTLQIQRYTMKSGAPHNSSFTFIGEEISTLYNFIQSIRTLPIEGKEKAKYDDQDLQKYMLNKEQVIQLVHENYDLITEVLKGEVTADEIGIIAHRKKELEKFDKLLNDVTYFENCRNSLGQNKKKEDVWQTFFEENTWIFGYGLNYVFNSPLEDRKLEQVVSGYDFNSAGKRIDALMKTRGIINSFCFGEIKVHDTPLLKQVMDPYRGECWSMSDQLAGAIAQTQKTVQLAISNTLTKINVKNKSGDPTGEQVFMYQPRSYVVIGSLSEFVTPNGINEDKYSSFELFRRNIHNPEIITFDELLERAKYIVASEIKGTE